MYATGEDFPDALIAGNYAGTKEASVLLVKCDSLPEPIEKYTKESKIKKYATGEDFPDALIAGNYAGTKEASVLLVKCDSLPEPIEKYTKESKIKKATIIGGVNAVSDKVFNLIKAIINR